MGKCWVTPHCLHRDSLTLISFFCVKLCKTFFVDGKQIKNDAQNLNSELPSVLDGIMGVICMAVLGAGLSLWCTGRWAIIV